MKKKFSKILGVALTIALLVSLGVSSIPVAAAVGVVTVTPVPAGPLSGVVTFVVDYDGAETPLALEVDLNSIDTYRHFLGILGQGDPDELMPHPLLQFHLAADEADPTKNFSAIDLETAREMGIDPADISYDAVAMEWTIVINTLKKAEVGDGILMALGWWPGQEVYFDGVYSFWFEVEFTNPADDTETSVMYVFDNEEEITPELGLNAKGAQQKFWLNYIDFVDGAPVALKPYDSGIASGVGTVTTLNDTSKSWTTNEHNGQRVYIYTDGMLYHGLISANTATQLTFGPALTNATESGDKYYIGSGDGGWLWAFDGGINLSTWGDPASDADVKVLAGGRPYTDKYGNWHPAVYVAGPDVYVPDRFVEVVARATDLGDAEFEVWTCLLDVTPPVAPDGGTPVEINEQVASAEKKWGELDFSKLDIHIEGYPEDYAPALGQEWIDLRALILADLGDGPEDWEETDHVTWVDSGEAENPVDELVAEKVWARFLQVDEPQPAGGALVHWWLAEDTEANQEWIQVMMDDIVARAGDKGFRGHDPDEVDSNEYWSATGDYAQSPALHPADQITAWISDPLDPQYAVFTNLVDMNPADDPYLEKDTPMGSVSYINPGEWYGRNLTMDYHPGEIPGLALAIIRNAGAEDVLVITLVEYQQNYNGENLILIQIGKKHFRQPPPPVQVKIPQIRWAGEKIVLEKDWGEHNRGRWVTFTVDQDSIGVLSPVEGWGSGFGNHVQTWVMEDGVARVIFESEYEGQAEVKAVLYDLDHPGPLGIPIDNHDFPMFYLKLESIEPLDPTPAPLLPDADALFGVQVKGWFITKSSEHSSRPSKWLDIDPLTDSYANVVNGANGIPDDDHDILLPAGRWVLPDDWPTLAGIYELRRHWDLMNNWEDQVIFSGISPIGPYDNAVVTTTPPELAEAPVIGPFNTTQPVAIEDELIKWVATASVWADYLVALPGLVSPTIPAPHPDNNDWTTADLRNTVVPDGKIDWFDAPMPPAKVIFQVAEDQLMVDLSPVPKAAIAPYSDIVAGIWWAPYYFQEIPSHAIIPMGGIPEGYSWDSWGVWSASVADDGPYDFWWDLGETTLPATDDEVIEVYSDNNGIAYVRINALGVAGEVDIHAKADYPYQRKHPALKSVEVTQVWGPLELDSYFESLTARTGDAPLTMTFINMSTGGILPYVSAIWDWGDGTAPGTTAVDFGDTITHTYTTAGSYSPSLTITDSSVPTPLVSVETKEADYILVTGEVPPEDILAYYRALTGDAMVADLGDVIAAANDYLGGVIPTGFMAPITLTQLIQLANEWLGL